MTTYLYGEHTVSQYGMISACEQLVRMTSLTQLKTINFFGGDFRNGPFWFDLVLQLQQ